MADLSSRRLDEHLVVLHTLRLRGFAEAEAVTELMGLPTEEAGRHLAAAGDAGLAKRREGRLSGWSLTPEGRAAHAALLAAELQAAGCSGAIEAAYDMFLKQNERFKQICTDWQMHTDASAPTINDHSDEAYDRAIVRRLVALHADADQITSRLATLLPRFARYPARLGAALARVEAGDRSALARPLSGSYHDVWMELHQDLLSTLDRQRSSSDGS